MHIRKNTYIHIHIHTYVHIRQSTSMPFSYYLHILSVNQNKKALVIRYIVQFLPDFQTH